MFVWAQALACVCVHVCTHLRDSLFHKWSLQMENVIQDDDDASLTQQGEDQTERGGREERRKVMEEKERAGERKER